MKDYVKEGFFEKCAELGFSKEAADQLYKSARIRGARVPFKNAKNFTKALTGENLRWPKMKLNASKGMEKNVRHLMANTPKEKITLGDKNFLDEASFNRYLAEQQLDRMQGITSKARADLGRVLGVGSLLGSSVLGSGYLAKKLYDRHKENLANRSIPEEQQTTIPQQVEPQQVAPVSSFMKDEDRLLNALSTTPVAKRTPKKKFDFDRISNLLHSYYDRNGYYSK